MTHRIKNLIARDPWAILPDSLETIMSIADGYGDPEAVEAKLGKPLKNTQSASIRDGVAVIPVSGPVFRYANLFTQISGATSIQVLGLDFNAALNDKSVQAIVLEIDSPGGMMAGVSEFADMIYHARGQKPIVAYISSLGASAAYWIASAADQIVINDTATVGSIGVVATYQKSADENSIEIVSSQSPNKRPDIATDEGRQQAQSRVDRLADVFIETVARNRQTDAETVINKFGQGGLSVGADAVALGMADRLGSLEGLIAELGLKSSQSQNKKGDYRMLTENQNNQAQASESVTAAAGSESATITAADTQASYDKGFAAGRAAELARIQGVEAQSLPGHETLIQTLKFDGKTTGEQAAIQILAAEKTKIGNFKAQHKSEAPEALPFADSDAATTTVGAEEAPKTLEEKLTAEWNADAKLQAEMDLDAYLAYGKAKAEKRI